MSVMHPLTGEFDTAHATWTMIPGNDGSAGLEVGFADKGLVALREAVSMVWLPVVACA
jgi:hypothetical protein